MKNTKVGDDMYPVTDDYKVDIEKQIRNESYVRITFGITNTDAIGLSTITDNGHIAYSNVNGVDAGTSATALYATAEPGRWVLDGRNIIPDSSNYIYQGYIGNKLSDENGIWQTPPEINITFSDYVQFAGLSFRFDLNMNEPPKEFRIQAYYDDDKIVDVLTYPDNDYWVYKEKIPICNKLRFVFEKSAKPYRRARLITLIYGIVDSISEQRLVSCSLDREIDLLSTEFPKNDFNFTIFDPKNEYNPENPDGVWEYLETRQPISVDIGYKLDNGNIEWQQWANTYSTGDVSVDGTGVSLQITIESANLVNHLNMTYDEGKYYEEGRSLYDLANDVMAFAGFSKMIELDNSLKDIITFRPLPSKAVNECLQLIANAGRCVLDVTRAGLVSIKPHIDNLLDFSMNFDKMYNPPTTTKIPPLRNLTSKYFEININSESKKVVTDYKVNNAVNEEFVFNHSAITNGNLTVSGLSIIGDVKYYAYKTVAVLNGTGTVNITGNEVEETEISISKRYGDVGEDLDSIYNELVTDRDNANAYLDWVATFMLRRNTYEVEDRGYPELDLSDNITLTTTYESNIEAIVVAQNIEFNGAISGTSKYLKRE